MNAKTKPAHPAAPQFDSEDAAPADAPSDATRPMTAEDIRAAQIAAIHADRIQQAAVHTRFDAAMFVRKEQR